MTSSSTQVLEAGLCESDVFLSRVMDAPRDLVWAAYTQAGQAGLKQGTNGSLDQLSKYLESLRA